MRLRLLGSCDGCPSSSVTLTLAVEGAIEAAAPEVTAIEVESPDDKPAGASVISLNSLRVAPRRPEPVHGASWASVPELATLAAGSVHHLLRPATSPIVACRVGAELFAFRDECPSCHAAPGRRDARAPARRRRGRRACCAAPAATRTSTCAGPAAASRTTTLHLDPLPLLSSGGTVSVAVPVPAPA